MIICEFLRWATENQIYASDNYIYYKISGTRRTKQLTNNDNKKVCLYLCSSSFPCFPAHRKYTIQFVRSKKTNIFISRLL